MSRRKGRETQHSWNSLSRHPGVLRARMVGRGWKGFAWVQREDRRGEKKVGSGGLLRPNEEMIHWNVELICGCQFLFHSVVLRVWSVCPHHSLDPTSSSTCLGPAQLGSARRCVASFPLHWEADMQRTIVNAWLQNFTHRRLIAPSSGLPLFP